MIDFDEIINKMNLNWTENLKYRYLYIQTGMMLSEDEYDFSDIRENELEGENNVEKFKHFLNRN